MKTTASIIFGLLPIAAFAQTTAPDVPLGFTLENVIRIINQIIPIMPALAVLLFFWGIVKFIANAGDPEARKSGVHFMVWGMIALFVMVGFWGIIGYVQETLGISGTVTPGTAPTVPPPVPSVAP